MEDVSRYHINFIDWEAKSIPKINYEKKKKFLLKIKKEII